MNATRSLAVVSADVSRVVPDMLHALPDGLLLMDREYRVLYANERGRQISRFRPEDLNGPTHWELFPATVGTEVERKYRRVMEERVPQELEIYYEPFRIWLRICAYPAGEGMAVHYADITELKMAQIAHEVASKRMHEVLEATADAVFVIDRTWTICYLNRAAQAMVAAAGIVVGRGIFNAFPKMVYDGSPYVEHYFRAMNEGIGSCFETSYGEPFNIQVLIDVKPSEEGILIFCRDVTKLRADEAALRASEERHRSFADELRASAGRLEHQRVEAERRGHELQAVYDNAPVGMALFDPVEYRYLEVNRRQCEIIGLAREQIIGQRFVDIATTPVIPELFAKVAAGESVRDQTVVTDFRNRPGDLRTFNVNYAPVLAEDGSVRAISAAVLEITQLRRAEAALVQSEKLAAVGRLASSISHEINNPLEAVTNLLYIAVNDPAMSDETRGYLKLAQDELRRVGQIATQTLRFHRQADNPTAVSAAQLVDPVLNLYAGRLVNSGIHVEACYSTACKVLCFENDIRQVLNNLIANAIDAMRVGGRLVVRAHDACDLRSGTRGVRIAIADTGHGMKAETVSKIFEPFYTTKGLNGNGLGLWISKGIVERHQGHLRVRSSQDVVGHGTAFTLFLPAAE